MIEVSYNGRVIEMCINRPDKKNALSHQMYFDLMSCLQDHGDDQDYSAIIIHGAGGVFTAGADLNDFKIRRGSGDSPGVKFLRALSRTRLPVIAAVEGFAVGIGATLLQHCDFVYAPADARLRMPFVALGLCPEGGSSLLLERVVGRRKARDWLLTGRFFKGQEAFEAGLITELVPAGGALLKARETAAELGRLPRGSLVMTKQMLNRWSQPELDEAFDNEVQMFAQCLNTEATQGSITATGKTG